MYGPARGVSFFRAPRPQSAEFQSTHDRTAFRLPVVRPHPRCSARYRGQHMCKGARGQAAHTMRWGVAIRALTQVLAVPQGFTLSVAGTLTATIGHYGTSRISRCMALRRGLGSRILYDGTRYVRPPNAPAFWRAGIRGGDSQHRSCVRSPGRRSRLVVAKAARIVVLHRRTRRRDRIHFLAWCVHAGGSPPHVTCRWGHRKGRANIRRLITAHQGTAVPF